MNFRNYTSEWKDSIISLNQEAMEEFSSLKKPKEELSDLLNIEETYQGKNGIFLIGVEDGELIAMGGFKYFKDGKAELKRMRIKKELRGKGIGSILLSQIEEEAKKNNVNELFLETAKARQLTLSFYQKHGYKCTGEDLYGEIPVATFSKKLLS